MPDHLNGASAADSWWPACGSPCSLRHKGCDSLPHAALACCGIAQDAGRARVRHRRAQSLAWQVGPAPAICDATGLLTLLHVLRLHREHLPGCIVLNLSVCDIGEV